MQRTLLDLVQELERRVSALEHAQKHVQTGGRSALSGDEVLPVGSSGEPSRSTITSTDNADADAARGVGHRHRGAEVVGLDLPESTTHTQEFAPVVEADRDRGGIEPRAGAEVEGRHGASHGTLEERIGRRWAAIAGAVVFVIGIGLLIVLAVNRGWLGGLSPGLKCSMAATVGVVLLVLAERVRVTMGRRAAVGLNAAGLGVLYTSVYAAYSMYALFSPGAALVVLTAVVVVGVVIAARAELASVGVVALVAGFVTPLLVPNEGTVPLMRPAYLFALLLAGVALSAWKRGRPVDDGESTGAGGFWAVRFTAVLGTVVLGFLWAASPGVTTGLWGLVLALACFVVVWAELAWSLTGPRAAERAHPDSSSEPRIHPPSRATGVMGPDAVSGMAGAAVLTLWAAWMVWRGTIDLADGRSWGEWSGLAAMASALLALALLGHPEPRRLCTRSMSAIEAALSMAAFFGVALLFIASARALSPEASLLVWAAAGAATAWAGATSRITSLSKLAASLLVAASVRLGIAGLDQEWGAWGAGARAERVLAGVAFTPWSAWAVAVAAAWLVAAGAWSGRFLPRAGALVAACILTLTALALDAQPGSERTTIHILALSAAALAGLRPWLTRARPAEAAVVPLLAAALGFIFVDVFGEPWDRPAWSDSLAPDLLHPGLFAAASVAAAIAWVGACLAARAGETVWGGVWGLRWGSRWGSRRAWLPPVVWALASVLPVIATTLEAARVASRHFTDHTAKAAAVSLWWLAIAVGLLAAGLLWRGTSGEGREAGGAGLRRVGLGFLGASLLKVVVYDLAEVSLEWRVVSFLTLGVVLMGVGLAYARTRR